MLPSTLLFLFGFVLLIGPYDRIITGCDIETTLFVKEDTGELDFTHEHDLNTTVFFFTKVKPSFKEISSYVKGDECNSTQREPNSYESDIEIGNVSDNVRGRIYANCSNETISYTITHPTPADTGLYILSYKRDRNSDLTFICWAAFVMNIEMLTSWPILVEGSTVHFHGKPAASSDENKVSNLSVTWLLDGHTSNQTDHFLAKDDHMWIPRVTRDLDGKSVMYRVQFDDVVGEVYYNLSVIYIEKDTENDFVEEGSSISFHVNGIDATSDESEAMTYNWTLDGRFINENYKDRLWLPYLTRELNQKNVTCVIQNENGTVAELNYVLQVAYGPSWPVKLIPPNTAYYLAPGDSVPEIRCEVDCNPPCTINWGDFGDGDTLILGQVSKTDTGEYICTASRNGSDRVMYRSVYVYVQVSEESSTTVIFLLLGILITLNSIAIVIIIFCLWRFYKILSAKASKSRDTLNMSSSNLRAAETKEQQTVPGPTGMYEALEKGAQEFKQESAYYSSLEQENSCYTNTSTKKSVK